MRWSMRSLFVLCVFVGTGCSESSPKKLGPPSSGGLAGLGGTPTDTGGSIGTGGNPATGGSPGTGGTVATGGTGGTSVVEPPAHDAAEPDAPAPDAGIDAPLAPDLAADVAADLPVADAPSMPDLAPDLASDLSPDLAAPTPDLASDLGPDASTSALCTPSGARPALKRTVVVAGLARPVSIVGPPDEPDTLWVLEHRTGNVKVIKNGAITGTLAHVTVASDPGRTGNEEGAYSIALPPDYATSHLFYIFYSSDDDPNYSTTVDEFHKTGATAAFVRNVYSRPSSAQFHNGGDLAFHPVDKHLYISVGDNQDGGGPSFAQMTEGDWGRILKLDLAGGGTTMHYGLRNPWRFSFDAANGDLYIGDVGESGADSENVFYSKVGSAKTNFGWVGTNTRPPALDQGGASNPIIGGIVYRGTKMPGLCGFYVYGRYGGGNIKTLKVVNGAATMVAESAISTATLSTLGTDAAGELYFAELSSGIIYRIDPN
jgi:hypothetical protein